MVGEKWTPIKTVRKTLYKAFNKNYSGPTLLYNNGIRYIYDAEGNTVILGETGTGKSRRFSYATVVSVLQKKETLIALDPKGELYKHTACFASKDHKIVVLNFRDITKSIGWNPLDLIADYYYSKSAEDRHFAETCLDELAHIMYPLPSGDPFWILSARSLFIGAVYALLEFGDRKDINLCNVYNLIASGEERYGSSTYLKEFYSFLPKDSVAAMQLNSYVTTASDTKAGIRSVALEGLSIYARSESLKRFTSLADFHIKNLDGDKPAAIFILIPDESPIYDQIVGNLCSQLLNHYIRIAQRDFDGRLPVRVNVILEELGNIGKAIVNLPHLMTASRSRNMRLFLILQGLSSQLTDIYGKSKAETILENASNTIAFRTSNFETLKELSQKCGERFIRIDGHMISAPLITPSQLGAMETGQALVMIRGKVKYITRLPDFSEIYDSSITMMLPDPPKRDNRPIHMFDIKEFVRKKKDEQNSSLNKRRHPFGMGTSRLASMDIDEMIAEIDKQIAALEKEEKNEDQ